MAGTAVFIDGGYLNQILWHAGVSRIDFDRMVRWICGEERLLRAYYYTAPLPLSDDAAEEERQQAEDERSFFEELERGYHFEVRLGRLAMHGHHNGKPNYQQKQVDLLLGLDVASLASKGRIDVAALLTGDSDFIPAVKLAKREGVVVRLVHGPEGSYSHLLWQEADERLALDHEMMAVLRYEGGV